MWKSLLNHQVSQSVAAQEEKQRRSAFGEAARVWSQRRPSYSRLRQACKKCEDHETSANAPPWSSGSLSCTRPSLLGRSIHPFHCIFSSDLRLTTNRPVPHASRTISSTHPIPPTSILTPTLNAANSGGDAAPLPASHATASFTRIREFRDGRQLQRRSH